PAHFDGGVVSRAADRFFVIESRGRAIRHSRREKRSDRCRRSTVQPVSWSPTRGAASSGGRGPDVCRVAGVPERLLSAPASFSGAAASFLRTLSRRLTSGRG